MVVTIEVKGLKGAERRLEQFSVNVGKMSEKDARTTMNLTKVAMKKSLADRKLRWKGYLDSSIRYRKTGKGKYAISMLGYGLFLDSMKPHWVPLFQPNRAKRFNPDIMEWARQYDVLDNTPFLMVRPQKWIGPAMAEARREFKRQVSEGNTIRMFRRR